MDEPSNRVDPADEVDPTNRVDPADEVLRPSARQLRVLAHPLRSRLLGALRLDGPATATALAARLGTNSGATSYHLRQLAAVGVVEEERSENRRDRVWRAAHRSTSWVSTDFDHDPDAQAADGWILRHQAATAAGWVDDWLATRSSWSVEWRAAADLSDYRFNLSPSELRALMAELQTVLAVWVDRADPTADDSRSPVTLLVQAFPAPNPRL